MTTYRIGVRELAEFVHRRGDLGGQRSFQRSNRALEGAKGHRRLQNSRGTEYEAEVSVERIFAQKGVDLRVTGRVDGIFDGLVPIVEEIKTVERHWTPNADPVHFAQLRLYAALLVLERGYAAVSLQLTYLALETAETTTFREEASKDDLITFLEATVDEWFSWLLPYTEWILTRDASIETAEFPFKIFRSGQRDLAATVYRSIRDKTTLFVEAPTGMGKTLATVFPAIKGLPLLAEGKVFYVTAKTSGQRTAEDALKRLRTSGVRVRSVALTAKTKICFNESGECESSNCPFTKGYFDRVKPAIRELLERDGLDREAIRSVAEKHRVCPFELSLDVSRWADVLIGDFNYVFDPAVALQRYFEEGKPRHVVLVDEAHNLVERSREMYSASLSSNQLLVSGAEGGGKGLGKVRAALTRARNAIERVCRYSGETILSPKSYHRSAIAISGLPEELTSVLKETKTILEIHLISGADHTSQIPWLEPFFELARFLTIAEIIDDTYRIIADPDNQQVTLFCLDPSKQLSATIKGLRSAVFFSATLSPLDYFVELLGGQPADKAVTYESPFDPKQIRLTIAPYDVSYQSRDKTLGTVADTILKLLQSAPGNHLIFCPSFVYLGALFQQMSERGVICARQSGAMTDQDKNAFLKIFSHGTGSVGLAVLGGIFSEGIDLPGAQLVGITVIGIGLPSLSIERDLLAAYFALKERNGFDYAYRLPGMSRVLQAAGRLIRSEEDSGDVLLIDKRYQEARTRTLFPKWWEVRSVFDDEDAFRP